MPPHSPIIELASLSHAFGARRALAGVSLEVNAGVICGILGPNGGGKSTLFKILATLLRPASGTARVAGADVVTQRHAVRRSIGVIFQRPALDGKLTARENLMCHGHMYGLTGPELRAQVALNLQHFGVDDRASDRVETLSGGLQRRVELAKAMLHRPRILLLDEPSTGLDPAARRTLLDRLRELQRQDGVTTLLTTHLTDEAEHCDYVAVLNEGRLAAFDTPAALKATIGGDVLTVMTRNPDVLRHKITERFAIQVEHVGTALRMERAKGHEFVPQLIESFPGEIESVSLGKPTLEDVFVHLTGRTLASADSENGGSARGRHAGL